MALTNKNITSTNIPFTNHRLLYFSIGSTLGMFFYVKCFLSDFSNCFLLDTGANSLGLSFYYTLDMVQTFFEERTRTQLLCYRQFLQIWDTLFAFIYTLMYASWMMYFLKNKRLFLIIPVLAMFADWAENSVEMLMLETYLNSSPISESFVSLGSGINSCKWLLSILTYLIILIGMMSSLKIFFTKSKLG